MARGRPASDSKVRSISSSRHWTSTWMVDVVGDEALLDDLALEVVVGLGGRGEAHLDLLEPDVHQGLEQRQLALGVHRVDQGLVAVAQVDAGPPGRHGQLPVRPGPVGQAAAARRGGRGGRAWGRRRRAWPSRCPACPSASAGGVLVGRCSWGAPSRWLGAAWLLDAAVAAVGAGDAGANKKPPGRGHRRLRANAMWRSPSGKEEVRGRGAVHQCHPWCQGDTARQGTVGTSARPGAEPAPIERAEAAPTTAARSTRDRAGQRPGAVGRTGRRAMARPVRRSRSDTRTAR